MSFNEGDPSVLADFGIGGISVGRYHVRVCKQGIEFGDNFVMVHGERFHETTTVFFFLTSLRLF
jgi:hypothetical protein